MKLESNWQQKTLEELEKDKWPNLNETNNSHLIQTCYSLRKKPLQYFTVEELRIMIGQEMGLFFLIPSAIEKLEENLLAEGDMYEGDLLNSVLNVSTTFWNGNKNYWQQLNDLIKDNRVQLAEMNFEFSNFDNCIHKC